MPLLPLADLAPPLLGLILAAGLLALLFGGDVLVRGSVALAQRWRIPPLIIGLTVVAFGTSAPELVVSIQSVGAGAPGLALGNIVGSNIANILLVLALPALFWPLTARVPGVKRSAIIALAAAVMLVVTAWDREISLAESLALLCLILTYVAFLAWASQRRDADPIAAELTELEPAKPDGRRRFDSIMMVLGGLVALPVGAHLVVGAGVEIASSLGVDETIIGLTAIALGTSLPELAAVVMASLRRQAELAIGNVLGSNIFNILAVGGAAGLASAASGTRLTVPDSLFAFDLWLMLGATLVMTGLALTRRPIGRGLGGLMLLAYLAYVFALGSQAAT